MSGRRKLLVSTVSLLRRTELRFIPRPSPDFHPDPQSSRVFTRSFLFSGYPRVSGTCSDHLFPESGVSGTFPYSSQSDDHDGGGSGRCWNCGAVAASPGPLLSCDSCRSVQPMDHTVDYFQIFGLEKGYEIRDHNLEGKYKDWQKKLHPDLVHSKSEKEKAFAAEQSARVIDAYRTLSKPRLRASYLLELEGIHVDEERIVTDPELLAEMMDIREAVEEASDSETLKQIQSQTQRKLETWSNSFGEAFRKREFDDAITSIQRMIYYERAIEEIIKKL